MYGLFGTKDFTKEQKRQYIRSKNEISKNLKYELPHYKYARNDIMGKIIKNCRGVKKSNDGINR